jgi:hypothetical protein
MKKVESVFSGPLLVVLWDVEKPDPLPYSHKPFLV